MRLLISTIAMTIILGVAIAPVVLALNSRQDPCIDQWLQYLRSKLELCDYRTSQQPATVAENEAAQQCYVNVVSSYAFSVRNWCKNNDL